MDAVRAVLKRVRDWFLVWYVLEAVAGTAAAAYVLESMSRQGLLRYATGGAGAASTILAGIGVSLLLLLLAWAVLTALLDLKPWARTTMLVIGWITVVPAVVSLLTLPGSSALLEALVGVPAGEAAALAAVSALTKGADLLFWSWVLYVLQLNPAVRDAFVCRQPSGRT